MSRGAAWALIEPGGSWLPEALLAAKRGVSYQLQNGAEPAAAKQRVSQQLPATQLPTCTAARSPPAPPSIVPCCRQ